MTTFCSINRNLYHLHHCHLIAYFLRQFYYYYFVFDFSFLKMVRRRTAAPKPSAPVRSASPRSTSSSHQAPPPQSTIPPRPGNRIRVNLVIYETGIIRDSNTVATWEIIVFLRENDWFVYFQQLQERPPCLRPAMALLLRRVLACSDRWPLLLEVSPLEVLL